MTNPKNSSRKVLKPLTAILCLAFVSVNIWGQDAKADKLLGKQIVLKTADVQPVRARLSENSEKQKYDAPDSESKESPRSNLPTVTRSQVTSSEIDSFIKDSCRRYKIDPKLIYAQMKQESSFKLRAISYKGARGLMQLMPATAARFGVTDIYDPRQNIEAGVKYMRFLLDLFGDIRLALAGYNAGEGAVIKYGNRIPPYRETIQYVEKISYNYYGETGHGTAFAWNLPLAMRYAGDVYQGRSISVRPQVMGNRAETLASSDVKAKSSDGDDLRTDEPVTKKVTSPVGQNDIKNVSEPSGKVLSSSLFIIKK